MVVTRACVYNGVSTMQDDQGLLSPRVVGLEGQLEVIVHVILGWRVCQPEPGCLMHGTLEDNGDLGKLMSSHHC